MFLNRFSRPKKKEDYKFFTSYKYIIVQEYMFAVFIFFVFIFLMKFPENIMKILKTFWNFYLMYPKTKNENNGTKTGPARTSLFSFFQSSSLLSLLNL